MEVWGRGAVDMLNQTAAMAVAMRRLAESGFRPRGTLLYLAVADEEAGSMQGAAHLLDAHPDVVRADYVLTEVGGIVSEGAHGTNVEVVTGEKGGAVVDIVVTGTPSHGSTPFGADNAVVKAAEVVRRLAEHRPETHISDSWRGWVEGQPFDADLKAVLTDPERLWDALPDLPHALAARAHSCTHTTYAPTVIHGGHKRNIICDRVVVQPDIRIAHGESVEQVVAELHRMLADFGDSVEINVVRSGEPTESPTDTPLWSALERAAAPRLSRRASARVAAHRGDRCSLVPAGRHPRVRLRPAEPSGHARAVLVALPRQRRAHRRRVAPAVGGHVGAARQGLPQRRAMTEPGFDDLDLDALHRRQSSKWRKHPPSVLPAWVAEMDFPVADPDPRGRHRDRDRGRLRLSGRRGPGSHRGGRGRSARAPLRVRRPTTSSASSSPT